ncbi:MAG: hypothetical protein J6S53_10875 [Lentisphaeria bacterium]|nr:hypothetical protein [Lentisphaeria bacterium]
MNPEELHNMDENQNKSWIGETVEMDFEPGLNIPEEKNEPGSGSEEDVLTENGTGKKILLLGIGGSGTKIIKAFRSLAGSAHIRTAVIDTDKEDLASSNAHTKIQAEVEWTVKSGLGCGGDVVKGERAVERERSHLTKALSGYDYIIVAGGLGGGTATGGIRTVASVARQLATPALFMLSTPFSFESYTKRKNADEAVKELLQITDALVTLPNDILFSTLPPDAAVEESFLLAAESLAWCVLAVAELLASRKLIGGDFADFLALLRKKRCSCAVGVGRASSSDGLDRCAMALENMLESPFLGGMSRFSQAHAVILTITGGKNLSIGEMRQTLDRASSLVPGSTQFMAGVTINPAMDEEVLLTCFAIRYDSLPEAQELLWQGENSVPDPVIAPHTTANAGGGGMEQGMLDLQSFSKGIFADLPVTKYKDEDLDIPTYQRRGISIDKGTVGK